MVAVTQKENSGLNIYSQSCRILFFCWLLEQCLWFLRTYYKSHILSIFKDYSRTYSSFMIGLSLVGCTQCLSRIEITYGMILNSEKYKFITRRRDRSPQWVQLGVTMYLFAKVLLFIPFPGNRIEFQCITSYYVKCAQILKDITEKGKWGPTEFFGQIYSHLSNDDLDQCAHSLLSLLTLKQLLQPGLLVLNINTLVVVTSILHVWGNSLQFLIYLWIIICNMWAFAIVTVQCVYLKMNLNL